jgi:site-specific DNA-cytosine methylase
MYVVDLFCGCGGFSTGAKKAGHTIVLAIDNWQNALNVHKYNHPKAKHVNMELGGSPEDMKKLILTYVPVGQKWHLHGSPPCQNLSAANRTNQNKGEGMRLVYWYLDLVKLCKPTSWTMEQVIGAQHHLGDFDQKHVINTKDYGVPQTRKRLFIGSGWSLPPTMGERSLVDKLPYLKNEGISYVKGYSNTRSVKVDGVHMGNIKNVGLQGYRPITEPTFTLCAAGPLGLFDGKLNKIRSITIREALTIQGFPEDYNIPDNVPKTLAYKLIGNSVSPAIAYLIMR